MCINDEHEKQKTYQGNDNRLTSQEMYVIINNNI